MYKPHKPLQVLLFAVIAETAVPPASSFVLTTATASVPCQCFDRPSSSSPSSSIEFSCPLPSFQSHLRVRPVSGKILRLSQQQLFGVSTSNLEGEYEDDEDEEEKAEPGTMRVSEIKAELKLRGVSFADCFDKDSLVVRLQEARAKGKADPKILDDFNKKKLDATFKGESSTVDIDDDQINAVVGGDGTLPGGLTPDKLKDLVSNPELMTLLQSTKVQDIMKLTMTEGQEALEKTMEEDDEIRDIVEELNRVMKNAASSSSPPFS